MEGVTPISISYATDPVGIPGGMARDMKVDASSIHLETPLNPSVSCTHGWRALLWGRWFNLRPGPEGTPNRPGRLRTTCQQAGCQPAAGCHPAPRAASDSTFMSHTLSKSFIS